MANLAVLVNCFTFLQESRLQPNIMAMTTPEGRISVPLQIFMSFGGITDIPSLLEYGTYLKSSRETASFRLLLCLGWDQFPRGINMKLNFYLTTNLANVRLLLQPNLPTGKFASEMAFEALPAEIQEAHVTPPSGQCNQLLHHVDEKKKVIKRVCRKKAYAKNTLHQYSTELERDIWKLIDDKVLTANTDLKTQLLRDVFLRLNKRLNIEKTDSSDGERKVVLKNVTTLVQKMILYGINDREQIRFMNSISLAVSGGGMSVAKIKHLTGLPRRALEQGRVMRTQFESEAGSAEKDVLAKEAASVPDDPDLDNDPDIVVEDYSDSETEGEDDNNVENNGAPGKRKRANRGEKSRLKKNRFRVHFSCKERNPRFDCIDGKEIQRFCHESPWGGRLDTLKLLRQQVIVEQPSGGLEYESVRSYQYSVTEMYGHFKSSEYGIRQRNANKGKDLSEKRFRELICPCMTHCKQRDTADEIVAEFKHCLLTWNVNMRKKDKNVKASIERCQASECPQHKLGSDSANLYASASKSPSQFLSYLLCPQIQRDELAVKVLSVPSSYDADLAAKKAINIESAVRAKKAKESDYRASGARKGKHYMILKKIVKFLHSVSNHYTHCTQLTPLTLTLLYSTHTLCHSTLLYSLHCSHTLCHFTTVKLYSLYSIHTYM